MPDSQKQPSSAGEATRRALQAAPVIIVGSVMFSFISYWRLAAVVLCDMASTMFYIGGIVEQMIGPAAPWFILAVMVFSLAMGTVEIESCAMFVRGGVYRVVKEAIGAFPAKMAVSALLFDFILTGPISSVSAGQYLIGWILEFVALTNPGLAIEDADVRTSVRQWGSVVIAVAITLYFFRKNLIGMHESSGKALRIMMFTTGVAVLTLGWAGLTLAIRGASNEFPTIVPNLDQKVEYQVVRARDRITGEEREMWQRDAQGNLVPKLDDRLQPVLKPNPVTGHPFDPLGFLPRVFPDFTESVRAAFRGASGIPWGTMFGIAGLMMAFGHSVLAMSGQETMVQVYREVESPKLPNFKKGAVVIFTYALVMTSTASFFAVLLIPDEVRMKVYADNLLGGLAMYVIGPSFARLALNALVVVAGFLILSGAVNTSIIGSNGVLNRVAEDGVLPDMLQRPHARYGTTHRILCLVVGLQLLTILASRGNMMLLGEAYAFGVLWSFTFNVASILVLRFKDRSPREFKVPFNIPLGRFEIPLGLGMIFVVLSGASISNLFTKELATVSGLIFSGAFLGVFVVTEHYTKRRRLGEAHEHVEQFTERAEENVSPESLAVGKPYRKLVAIRSPQNLYMLQRSLEETDPETTDVVVMTAKVTPQGDEAAPSGELDQYDRKLMTAVIELAEKVGKHIKPLVIPTNNPLYAVMNTAKSLGAQELVVGASNKFTAEEHLDQMAFYWINIHGGEQAPLTIRVLSRTWDVHYDIGGGNRIPHISERKARTVAELRAAGVGVQRVLMVHDNTSHARDLFETVLTTLDPELPLDLVHWSKTEAAAEQPPESGNANGNGNGAGALAQDIERAEKIGREMTVHEIHGEPGPEIVKLAMEQDYDLIVIDGSRGEEGHPDWAEYVREHSACPVCLLSLPAIQREVVDTTPSVT
jgi:amino acid transporter/nucleotide-binding universal stress UspA family protein